MSEQTLIEVLSAVVEQCAASETGQQTLAMYDHGIQFTPLDGDPFYLEVKGGKATLSDGLMDERSIDDGYEIKAETADFRAWFSSRERLSDLIEHGRMFPVASHTTKRHIDFWLAQIVRLGNGVATPKEVF